MGSMSKVLQATQNDIVMTAKLRPAGPEIKMKKKNIAKDKPV